MIYPERENTPTETLVPSLKSWMLVLLLLSTLSAWGQWSNDPAVNFPVCTATNDQALPVSISDGSNGVILTWRDDRNGPSNGNIFAQRFSATGVPLWGVNGIPICTAPNTQTYPAIVSDGAGGAIIAWHDPRNGVFNNDIYAQRVDGNGNVLWTANGVPICAAIDHQSWVLIVTDGASGAIITWLDQRSGSVSEVYAQRISAAGIVQWTADGLPLRTGFPGYAPQRMIPDGAGGAILAWYDPLGTGGPDPYVQRINSSGSLLWGPIGVNVCALGGSQEYMEITTDGANGVIIFWMDQRIFDANLYAQRVNSAGIPQWTANGVLVCGAAENQGSIKLVPDGGGGAILTWDDPRSGTEYDIYAQRVNASGTMQWAPDGVVVSSAPNHQFVPRILPDAGGGSLIAWTDARSGNYDIYAQRLDGTGVALWTANGVAISTAANSQDIITVAPAGSGMIVAWEDARGSNLDIYIQGVSSSGSLCGAPATPGSVTGPTALAPGSTATYSVTNDPGATSYSWTLPSGWSGTSTTNSINVTAGASGGTISVTASNACGSSSASTLSVTAVAASHTIVSFSPSSGPVSTIVELTGLNFDPVSANNAVAFNGTPATVADASATSITTQVPVGATNGPITVTISGVVASSPADFTVTSGLIVYNAISANGDTLNDLLQIEGIDLTQIGRIVILDRLGRIVFERSGYDNATNAFRGLSNDGKELPTGTYYYSIEFSSGASKETGFISLRR